MTRNELKKALVRWEVTCKTLHREWDALASATGISTESKLGSAVFSMLDAYTDAVADACGIQPSGVPEFKHDLDWYANENDFGRRCHGVEVNRRTRAIRTIDDLVWLVWPTIKENSK